MINLGGPLRGLVSLRSPASFAVGPYFKTSHRTNRSEIKPPLGGGVRTLAAGQKRKGVSKGKKGFPGTTWGEIKATDAAQRSERSRKTGGVSRLERKGENFKGSPFLAMV